MQFFALPFRFYGTLMSFMLRLFFCCCLAMLFSMSSASAQRLEVGGGIGSFYYAGTLSPTFNPINTLPAGQFMLRYNGSKSVVLRANLAAGFLRANSAQSDLYLSRLGDSFYSPVAELGLIMEYNFFDFRKYKSPIKGSPYLFGGIAGYYIPTAPQEAGVSARNVGLAIPFGVGYKHELSRNWNFNIEFGARKTFSGYLDGVNDRYPINPVTGAPGAQRGFKNFEDWYAMFNFGFTYTIITIDCPTDSPLLSF